jgi:hypothetical protein
MPVAVPMHVCAPFDLTSRRPITVDDIKILVGGIWFLCLHLDPVHITVTQSKSAPMLQSIPS